MTSTSKRACILALLLCTAAAEARVYKWVDSNGETHYSETVPRGQQASEVQPAAPGDSGKGGYADWMRYIKEENMNRTRKEAQEEKAEAAARAEREARQARCAKAKQDLEVLQRQRRIYATGPNGEGFMDDQTRAAYIEKAKQEMSENCE